MTRICCQCVARRVTRKENMRSAIQEDSEVLTYQGDTCMGELGGGGGGGGDEDGGWSRRVERAMGR